METGANLLPTEEHHGDKGRLHKEGEDAFDGEWGTEDVPYKPAVIAPVGTELKLQDDAGGDTNGKVNSKDGHPELGRREPLLVARAVIQSLHDGYNHAQTKSERHEEPMVDGCEGKLRSRPVDKCC